MHMFVFPFTRLHVIYSIELSCSFYERDVSNDRRIQCALQLSKRYIFCLDVTCLTI